MALNALANQSCFFLCNSEFFEFESKPGIKSIAIHESVHMYRFNCVFRWKTRQNTIRFLGFQLFFAETAFFGNSFPQEDPLQSIESKENALLFVVHVPQYVITKIANCLCQYGRGTHRAIKDLIFYYFLFLRFPLISRFRVSSDYNFVVDGRQSIYTTNWVGDNTWNGK